MKEFNHCTETKHALFNNKLRSTRNQIECTFGRHKSHWRILNRALVVDLNFAVKLVFACFTLHNFSECNRAETQYDVVQEQLEKCIWFSHVHIMIICISSILIMQTEEN